MNKNNTQNKYVIGIDYGTDSCRALVVNAVDGKEVALAVSPYPRWKLGKYCDPALNSYRQHPLDYVESLQDVIKKVLIGLDRETVSHIVGLSFDTTGSTPVLTDKNGTPLALCPGLEENPNAMFVLWKDHTAIREAGEINALAHTFDTDYALYEGGIYSSEWVWAKVLHILRGDEDIRQVAYSWTEHGDWMVGLLTGNTKPETMCRSRCAAGHKAMWNENWNGLPSERFFTELDPLLAGFQQHLFTDTHTADYNAGCLTPEWAKCLGLPENVVVAVGAIDAHAGAVGGGVEPNVLTRIMGTSTCDILICPKEALKGKLVTGICGQVDGSVLPGYIGLEAGQSAFGDIYAWFKEWLAYPIRQALLAGILDHDKFEALLNGLIPALSEDAAKIPVSESAPVALDWMNGRRTPDANQALKGAMMGLTLGTTAPQIFRTLVEATAFGSKAIVDRFEQEGIRIDSIIAVGGISQKSPFVMQTLSDVLGMPIKVVRSEQACALGAAMFAATAAGIYASVQEAQKAMGSGYSFQYVPNPDNHNKYRVLYDRYRQLAGFVEHNNMHVK